MKLKALVAITIAATLGCMSAAHANSYDHLYSQIDEFNRTPSQVAKQYHAIYKVAIIENWQQPKNSKGAYVRVKLHIKPDGTVKNARIETLTDELRHSMETAIFAAQPYRLPSSSAARLTTKFEAVFFVK